METVQLALEGRHVRLEPLGEGHVEGLAAAAAVDASLYCLSRVPQGRAEVEQYVRTALEWKEAGTAAPFAIVRRADGAVIGSTRFFGLERWAWPAGHARQGRGAPDVCEIGYTWLAASAIRTAANTEAKFLMLTHAFENWKTLRVCFHTDARNQRSRAALERIGARMEGVLRNHRMAADFIPRNSVCYAIVAEEWGEVKRNLEEKLSLTKSGDGAIG